jgi:hypothetical protein
MCHLKLEVLDFTDLRWSGGEIAWAGDPCEYAQVEKALFESWLRIISSLSTGINALRLMAIFWISCPSCVKGTHAMARSFKKKGNTFRKEIFHATNARRHIPERAIQGSQGPAARGRGTLRTIGLGITARELTT